jgi:Family of unknown function (DUF6812)
MVAESHSVRVQIQARDFWCEGDLIVPRPGGYKGRVLDLLNESKEFLALTDVVLRKMGETTGEIATVGRAGKPRAAKQLDRDFVEYDVLLLRRNEIQFVVPLD